MKKNKIIGIIILISVVFGTFSLVNASDRLLVSEGESVSLMGGDLFTLLLQIKSIKLNGDIFSDRAFINLKDFGTELKSQPVGRDNPFLNI